MCFHKNLQKHRLNKGLSQRAIAEIIGVAPSTYSLYEKGAREPDVEKIKLIAKTLNVSADCLLFDCEQNGNKVSDYTTDEKQLVSDYRELSEQGKEYIRQTIFIAKQTYKKSAMDSNLEKQA